MELNIGYGYGEQHLTVPDDNLMDVLLPNSVSLPCSGAEAVRRALAAPIGSPPLSELVRPGEKIVLITSDITRPVPSAVIVPEVLGVLYKAGVRPEDIVLVFGLGSHRRHTEQEKEQLVGTKVYHEIHCVDSEPEDCIRMGYTRRGTPVDVTRVVAEADRRICIGNVEFHWFAGFSGGGKAIMPGVSNRAAIQANHRLMADPNAQAAILDGNPLREDLDEAAAICGVDFIVNVVLDTHKQIVYAAAGDLIHAHRDACRVLKTLYSKPIPRQADIVVVSQGGAPKDLNLYQVQKALDNACHAVRPGGIVILAGRCQEGFGDETFQKWMLESDSPQAILNRISREFCLGGHKAAAFAKVLVKARIFLVSDLPASLVRGAMMEPAESIQAALDTAFSQLGSDASVLVMPYGGSTLPCVKGNGDSSTWNNNNLLFSSMNQIM